jgi:hypothetical protein
MRSHLALLKCEYLSQQFLYLVAAVLAIHPEHHLSGGP